MDGSKAMEVELEKLKVTNMTFNGTIYSFVHQQVSLPSCFFTKNDNDCIYRKRMEHYVMISIKFFCLFWFQHTWLEATRTCNKLGAVITDVTSMEEFQFIVQFCRKVRPPYTVWVGGVALGEGETYVWFRSGLRIPKSQLIMTPATDPDHGYCVRLNWKSNRPELSTWDCGRKRWFICKH